MIIRFRYVRTEGVADKPECVEATSRDESDGYSYKNIGMSLYRYTSRQSTVTLCDLTVSKKSFTFTEQRVTIGSRSCIYVPQVT